MINTHHDFNLVYKTPIHIGILTRHISDKRSLGIVIGFDRMAMRVMVFWTVAPTEDWVACDVVLGP